MRLQDERNPLRGPLGVSLLLHIGVVAIALLAFKAAPPIALPPAYRVSIVAAPPGERAIGMVREPTTQPEPQPEAPEPPRTREVQTTDEPAVPLNQRRNTPTRQQTKATPTQSTTKAPAKPKDVPRAGGGPKGDKGSDVATIKTEGLDFPFPAYLNNIVRQIALAFKPKNPDSPLRAQVQFIIRRDGTVYDFKFIDRSGVYAFDLEAKGAVERAAAHFGQLPDGFADDALTVVFSFDPQSWR